MKGKYLGILGLNMRMSDNLHERVQILCHVDIICIIELENRIICGQIFFNLLLMQMISTWHKIWTLSWRLSLMRNVQLMKTNIYIFRVYNIRIIATTKISSCFVPMIVDHSLVKKNFGPMIADHDLVKKRKISWMLR
jgi:hypothetical protein